MFLPTKTTGKLGAAVLVALVVVVAFFVSWQFEWHAPEVRM